MYSKIITLSICLEMIRFSFLKRLPISDRGRSDWWYLRWQSLQWQWKFKTSENMEENQWRDISLDIIWRRLPRILRRTPRWRSILPLWSNIIITALCGHLWPESKDLIFGLVAPKGDNPLSEAFKGNGIWRSWDVKKDLSHVHWSHRLANWRWIWKS